MFFLNLGLAELMALMTAASALVVSLYLLNRARRKQRVATLRFWTQALQPEASRQRRRIEQPVSLLLQLFAILLLLLAIAQPRLGTADTGAQDHVLVLDTSSWMAAVNGQRTLLDEAKENALRYLDRLPPADRVLLIRGDGVPVPSTPMTADRNVLRRAIQDAQASASALDLKRVLQFADEARTRNARRRGEIVLIAGSRVRTPEPIVFPKALRLIPIRPKLSNSGLRSIGLRRSATDSGVWDVLVAVHNYSDAPSRFPVYVQFAGSLIGGETVTLAPGAERELTYHLRTKAAGWLEARLLSRDALPDDDRAIVEIPQQRPLKLAVFSRDSAVLKPLLSPNPFVEVSYLRPEQPVPDGTDITVLDEYVPAKMPNTGILWLHPPSGNVVKVREHVSNAKIVRWSPNHEITGGLELSQVQLESADVLTPQPGDVAVAEVDKGPVILARSGPQRMILLGYHPGRSELRFEVFTPLLMANMLRWLKPDAFRTWELNAQTAGSVVVPADADPTSKVEVLDDKGRLLPFDRRGPSLRFYSGTPGSVRVRDAHGERVYSLTLPEVGESEWQMPPNVPIGLPARWSRPLARDVWQWLAVAAIALLFIEWVIFGRPRRPVVSAEPVIQPEYVRRAS